MDNESMGDGRCPAAQCEEKGVKVGGVSLPPGGASCTLLRFATLLAGHHSSNWDSVVIGSCCNAFIKSQVSAPSLKLDGSPG